MTYIFFFLNFIFLHSNETNKVGFVKFSTPDFVENVVNFKLFISYSQLYEFVITVIHVNVKTHFSNALFHYFIKYEINQSRTNGPINAHLTIA